MVSAKKLYTEYPITHMQCGCAGLCFKGLFRLGCCLCLFLMIWHLNLILLILIGSQNIQSNSTLYEEAAGPYAQSQVRKEKLVLDWPAESPLG